MSLTLFLFLVLATNIVAQVNQEWVARYKGSTNQTDQAQDIAVDNAGNVYVTGFSLRSSTGYDYTTVKYSPSGAQEWVATYNGPGGGEDKAWAIALDTDGNVYVTGQSTGVGTDIDFATVKYSPSGVQQWVARYNYADGNKDAANDIAVDAFGHIYVTGYSYVNSTEDNDYVTIRYDSNGNQKWVRLYNGHSSKSDMAQALAVDKAGSVYVTGYGYYSSTSNYDYITVKYDSTGTFKWQVWADGSEGSANSWDHANDIAIDASGFVNVTGDMMKTASSSSSDYGTIRVTSNGGYQWLSLYDGPGHDYDIARAIAVDNDAVYVTGSSYGGSTGNDYGTVKYNAQNGSKIWSATYNGPGNDSDHGTDVEVDASGNVFVTGYSKGSGTNFDFATVKYDPAGSEQWVMRYDGPVSGYEVSVALALDDAGNVYVTGYGPGTDGYHDFVTIKYSEGAAIDAGPVSIDSPADTVWSGYSYTPRATIVNFETDTITFPVACQFDSAGIVVYADTVVVTGLAGADSIQISFGDWIPGKSEYTMTIATLLEGDDNSDNDQLFKTITALLPPRDVAVISINAPEETVWSAHTYVPQATVVNLWEEPATFDVVCEFDSSGTTVYSDTVTVTALAGGDSTQVSFAGWTSGEGNGLLYTMTVTSLLEEDVNPDNDELSRQVIAIWPPRDVAAISIITPPDYVWSGLPHIPRVVVANLWHEAETFNVICEIDSLGIAVYSDIASVTNLAVYDSIEVQFDAWSAGAADEFAYQMTVTTLLTQDLNPGNDTISKSIHAVKAVADLDVQDYAGNLSANTMELTGVENSIVVGSYVIVNPDNEEKNVDLFDGPANVNLESLTFASTDLTTYDGRYSISASRINSNLEGFSSLVLGKAVKDIVQVCIPRKTKEETFTGTMSVTGSGQGFETADEFTLKLTVVHGKNSGPCAQGFFGEPLVEGNQLCWSNFGFGEQGFNLYRAEPGSESFTKLNEGVLNLNEYTDIDVEASKDYSYKLGLKMPDGKELTLGPLSITSSEEIGEPVLGVNSLSFRTEETEISYFLPKGTGSATLKVYDISGKLVKTLASGPTTSGFHMAAWNCLDQSGRNIAPGIYFCILSAGNKTKTQKMVVVN